MTREESIRHIEAAKLMLLGKDNQPISDLYYALDMAIKALEQRPCEDAISRQAVIDSLHSKFADGFDSDRWWNSMSVLYAINKVPPVNPTKTGHWIEHPEIETSTPEYLMFYECSECGDRQCFCKSDIHKKRFCSNCGCRMVEPQESEV